ncbi:SOS response-associated peptidase family protein [Chitinibacteraceae bacterium HSL-7]
MCVSFSPSVDQSLGSLIRLPSEHQYADRVWQDDTAPIVVCGATGEIEVIPASYGMVPKKKLGAGHRPFSTLNARAETVSQRPSYRRAWSLGYRCLVPMQAFSSSATNQDARSACG